MKKRPEEKHGSRHTRLYHIWTTMKARCSCETSVNYPNYGGRGVSVCKEWDQSFIAFKWWAERAGYADDLSIDRVDNDGNYCPNNCRWATRSEQSGNSRKRKDGITSRYRGVSKKGRRYVLQVFGRPSGKTWCGTFSTEEEAAKEYDRIVSEEIPSRIFRNFPDRNMVSK